MAKKKRYTDNELKQFEKMLLEKRSILVKELGYIEQTSMYTSQRDQGGELSGYSNHMADAASDFNNLETNFSLAQREGKFLVYIEEALERIRDKTYGICKGCDEEPNEANPKCPLIPKERLIAVPTATRCVACKDQVKKEEVIETNKELAKVPKRRL